MNLCRWKIPYESRFRRLSHVRDVLEGHLRHAVSRRGKDDDDPNAFQNWSVLYLQMADILLT
jgi:hypothetical protein